MGLPGSPKEGSVPASRDAIHGQWGQDEAGTEWLQVEKLSPKHRSTCCLIWQHLPAKDGDDAFEWFTR